MLGESRQASYLPPTAPNPGRAANAASTALRLLECNPESLLAPDASRRGGRLSAAKLARQRYEEALKANAVQGDLLEFDTPSSASKVAEENAGPHDFEASRLAPCLAPADGYLGSLGSAPERTERTVSPWPGDVVLARYSPHDAFYRARVVRVYSSRGLSLADVEWLRQGEDLSGLGRDFLGSSLDEVGLHRHGLQVGTDLRSLQAAESQPSQPSRPSQESRRQPEVQEAAPNIVLPDLLDFSPEERPRGTEFPHTSGGPSALLPEALDFAGAGLGINASPVRSPDGTTSLAKQVAAVKPEERFGFVSDLILQASDGSRE